MSELIAKILATGIILGSIAFFLALLMTWALGDDWKKYSAIPCMGIGGLCLIGCSVIAWILAKVWL